MVVMHHGTAAETLEQVMEEERARLVRLCAKLTGDIHAAEDLAQETLIEAWHNVHKLYDFAGHAPWLSAIARNVCLRWARRHGREVARRVRPEDRLHDAFDLDVELERSELAELLDRALALLSPDTRRVLVEQYVEEAPHAEIAARLGMSEGAVRVKLHRGKLELRRLFATHLREQAAPYGLAEPEGDVWQETRIWCAICGQRRLMGRWLRDKGDFTLRCPGCLPDYRTEPNYNMGHTVSPSLFHGVHGYKPALSRMMASADAYYGQALLHRQVPCLTCGRPMPLRIAAPPGLSPSVMGSRGVYLACESCNSISDICLAGLVLWRPEGRHFWNEHGRIRFLPEMEREVDGQTVVVVGFESVTGHARYEVVFAGDTYQVLSVH